MDGYLRSTPSHVKEEEGFRKNERKKINNKRESKSQKFQLVKTIYVLDILGSFSIY